MIYQFGEYGVDMGRAELRRRNELHKIESKVYLLLEILLTHHDRVVTKDEIIKHVWGGRIISDGSIDNTLSAARKAVGDDGKAQKLIKTFPGRGLRFVGDVHIVDDAMPEELPVRDEIQLASIAVLPFVDMSAAGDQKHLGDGIAEELLNVLAKIDGLSVISRTSGFSFRDKAAKISDIGEALGVSHVLEGSIRHSGSTLRITAQLIDTRTDAHLWSKTYDRTFSPENIFIVQDEIAAKIVVQLSLKLDVSTTYTVQRSGSVETYELYLRAQTLMLEKTPEPLARAEALYKQVIDLEPDYAPAYSGLVQTYQLMKHYAGMGHETSTKNMRPYVDRGLALAPGRPETLVAAGVYASFEQRYEDALLLFDRAIGINRNYSYAYTERAGALQYLGRKDESLQSDEMALVYDPISPSILGNISNSRYAAGDIEGALETARTNLKWNGEAAQALNMMARLLRHKADYVGAHKLLLRAAETNPDEYYVQSDLMNLYLDIGLDEQAVQAASRPGLKATAYALTGNPQKAMELARADPNDYDAAYGAYLVADYDFAFAAMGKEADANSLIQAGSFLPNHALWVVVHAYVLRQQGDERAELILKNLEKILKELSPKTTKFAGENLRAAALHMMRGDPDEALRWLDPLIEQGHVYLKLTKDPIFTPLANHPAYAARLKRMQKTAKKYRAEIEGRL